MDRQLHFVSMRILIVARHDMLTALQPIASLRAKAADSYNAAWCNRMQMGCVHRRI